MSGKTIYTDLSLKTLNLESATNIKNEAIPTISRILTGLTLHDKAGEKVTVTIELDEFAYDKPDIFRQAKATRCGEGQFKIEIGVGLIAQLSVLAKSIAADKNVLRGRTKAKLLRADVRKDGREKALGDFAFHYMLTFIVWHEVAHVVLGHLDWIKQSTGLNVLEEFGGQEIPERLMYYQTLEGDADRQAAIWSAAIIDRSLSSNPYLRYQSLPDAFYDLGYIYGALFAFLDSVDSQIPANQRKHPIADIRFGISLSFVNEYASKYHKQTSQFLMNEVYRGGVTSIAKIFHSNKKPFDLMTVFSFMHENGKRLADMGVRQLQYKLSESDSGSFVVSNL